MRKLLVAALLTLAVPVFAQDRMSEIERKIDALTREMETLKLGEAAPEPVATGPGVLGFAPAASKVYRAPQNKVSIGGYGEMLYQNFDKRREDGQPASTKDRLDFARAILYTGYKFNDWILFNSEIEFEHATTGNAGARGEVSVELAYLDFRLSEPLGVRAGLLLVPVGLTNEIHEPTTFHGVNRPSVERNVIPTTWRENGAGLFGQWKMLQYRTYVLAGLQADTDRSVSGFASDTWIRSSRQQGAQSAAEDFAWVGRVDVTPVEGTVVGSSLYMGEADQGLGDFGGESVNVALWEGHAKTEFRGLELKGLYALGRIDNAAKVNAARGFTDAARNSVGSRVFGGYGEAAFNVLSLTPTKHYLAPFFRYERYDTQYRTPDNFTKNPANSRTEYTAGLTYKPIPQVAIKGDHQWMRNQAGTGVKQWNLGIAYIF